MGFAGFHNLMSMFHDTTAAGAIASSGMIEAAESWSIGQRVERLNALRTQCTNLTQQLEVGDIEPVVKRHLTDSLQVAQAKLQNLESAQF